MVDRPGESSYNDIMRKIILALALASIAGCAPAKQDKEALVKINDYFLTSSDFENEINGLSAFEREDKTKDQLLDEVIQKKLLLLEAQREGLDRQAPFMRMVERFWEQSLLRAILDKRMDEYLATTQVSDEELQRFSGQTGKPAEEVRDVLLREKINRRFEEWLAGLRGRSRIHIDKEALDNIPMPDQE